MNKKDSLKSNYWHKNFNDLKVVGSSDDLQINIARTKNGKKIDDKSWGKTLSYILNLLDIEKNSSVLELCCGNGVIIGEIAKHCHTALGIDYSKELLRQLSSNYKNNNLSIQYCDVNIVELKPKSFDKIIIYFSIQHFNEKDAFLLIEKCIHALKPKGKILIGDIPDLDKKWKYINKPAYHVDYFKRVLEQRPKIGYWYQKDFFKAMESCFPGFLFSIMDQPSYQINSDHCFDLLIKKDGEK